MLKLILLLTLPLTLVCSERILGIVLMPSKSHAILLERILLEMAGRGHHVVMVTPFPSDQPAPNFEYVSVKETTSLMKADKFFARRQISALSNLSFLMQLGLQVTEMALNNPQVKSLSNATKFDLIVTEAFLSEAFFSGFAHVHKAPVVAVSTCMPASFVNYMAGNPVPYSYIPDMLLGFDTVMNFYERFTNAVFNVMSDMSYRLYFLPRQDSLLRTHFGPTLPGVDDLIKNVSLVLVNHHYSLAYPRPYPTNMVEVGGLHVDSPKPLPKELELYMNESVHGVVLFSLGSNLNSSVMPDGKIETFITAFSRVKENILWKLDESFQNLPPNVKVSKWLPQSDILAHPKTKAFITHGGLLSTIEAVHRGVPLVGIPIFGDQPLNMRQAERAGYAITVDFDSITVDTLVTAIRDIIDKPSYRKAAQRRSNLLQDTPLKPLNRAVYWIEYVLRHNGALHLRSAAQDLKWFELYMLDVAAAVIASFTLIAAILVLLGKTVLLIFRKINAKSKSNKVQFDKNK